MVVLESSKATVCNTVSTGASPVTILKNNGERGGITEMIVISSYTLGLITSIGIGVYKGAPFKGFFAGLFLSWLGVFLMLFVKNQNVKN